ncbi:MAG: hypothetical protein LAN62_04240 [Acidobacteriia bacterium]|nr:hypothetical protein [Terriglobia bacterium]
MATLATTYNARRFPAGQLIWDSPAEVHELEAPERPVAPVKPRAAHRSEFRFPTIKLRPILFAPVNALHRTLQCSLLAAIGLSLGLFGLQFPHSAEWDRAWLIVQLREFADPLLASLAAWARVQWPSPASVSYLPLGLALAVWFARRCSRAIFLPILAVLREPEPAEEEPRRSTFVEELQPLAVDSEQSRECLLKRYREIDGALRAVKRQRCAFLSIDVAGSTEMKQREEELKVGITFRAYMNMLEEIFLEHNAWKQAWTPDGVMVCFHQLDSAVAAAQTVLVRLRTFNRTENLLKTRISVRCGVNAGRVPIFDDSKLEKIAHRVIDITGHMQKCAQTDTLWLSTEVYKQLKDKSGFTSAGKQVDGYKVYQWSPRLTLSEQTSSALGRQEKLGNSDPTWC